MKFIRVFLFLLIPFSLAAQQDTYTFLGSWKLIPVPVGGPSGYYLEQKAPTTNPGPAGTSITDYDVNGPMSRHNLVTRVGYNPDLKAGDHGLYNAWESYFVQGDPQVESYSEFFSSTRTFSVRPWSFIVNLNTNGVLSGLQTDRLNISGASSAANTFQMVALASFNLDTGSGGTIPSGVNFRAHNASNQPLDLTVGATTAGGFNLALDGRQISGGSGIIIFEPAMAITAVPLWISGNGITHIKIEGDGKTTLGGLVPTGSATGKQVVCADATGVLYRSSTGTDCSN